MVLQGMPDTSRDIIELIERRRIALCSMRRKTAAVRLGDVIKEMVDLQFSPRQAAVSAVRKLWKWLLPKGLGEHCQIASLDNGVLTVNVDSSAYLYELQLSSAELLKQLQQQCPRASVAKIRFVLV